MRLAAVALALLAACATPSVDIPLGKPLPPTVVVRNDNFADVTAYLVRSGARFRLGMVRSMTTETFRVTDTPSAVRVLVVTFASGETFATDELVIHQDQRLDLTVAPLLSTSGYMLTNRR